MEGRHGTLEDHEDFVEVIVSFGGRIKRREVQRGYWERPKEIPGFEAELWKIDPKEGWDKDNIEIIGMKGSIIEVECARGGYYSVKVAVVPDTETEIPEFKTDFEKQAFFSIYMNYNDTLREVYKNSNI